MPFSLKKIHMIEFIMAVTMLHTIIVRKAIQKTVLIIQVEISALDEFLVTEIVLLFLSKPRKLCLLLLNFSIQKFFISKFSIFYHVFL